ncbi:MAG: Smr/MutS family protein [Spirochaetaceae bacterium]|jgi:DNA-nicking Smr family endonuclease|nr:Smr/MutS family protein [Spirochaetaceae bacterium]
MDFGDILDEWERRTAASSGKKQNPSRLKRMARKGDDGPETAGRSKGEVLKKVDPLTAWLRINPVYDKDTAIDGPEIDAGERRRRLHSRRPDATLDLHELTRDEAWCALVDFFRDSRERGFEKVLIVHGKGSHSNGEGVLKDICRVFIEQCPFAGESGHGKAVDGASGATWVVLKKGNNGVKFNGG